MQLYIWNAEYEYYLAVANSIEEAKQLIIEKSKQNEKIKEEIENKGLSTSEYLDEIYEQIIKNRLAILDSSKLKIFDIHSPDDIPFIFDIDKPFAYLMSHSNE